jgi:hypothetical protein
MKRQTVSRAAACAILCAVVSATCGCMQVDTVISVKKDGSGTLIQEAFLNPAMLQMMMHQMGGEQLNGDVSDIFDVNMNPETYRTKAKAMGKGVRFVKIGSVTENGRQGMRAIFSFTDIRNLSIRHVPDILGGPLTEFHAEIDRKAGGKSSDLIKFDFKNKKAPKLILKIPHEFDGEQIAAELGGPEPGEIPAEELGMMQQMFDGSRFRLIVKVDGRITFTNASHFEKSQKKSERDRIILMEMDVGKMVTDPKHRKAVSKLKDIEDHEEMEKELEKIPGLRYELEEFIEINF